LDLAPWAKHFERQVVAAIEFRAVSGEGIDLAWLVWTADEPRPIPSVRCATHDDDLAVTASPLALDAHEPVDEVEDQVVTTTLGDGTVDIDVEIERRLGNGQLGDRTLSIGR
jgi:hypothetical protein